MKLNRLKKIRQEHGEKQRELAKDLNVSQGTLSNWERGTHEPDNTTLSRLAQRFDVSVDYLLGLSDIPKPQSSQPTTNPKYTLLKAYQELDTEELEVLEKLAEQMLKLKHKGNNQSPKHEGSETMEEG